MTLANLLSHINLKGLGLHRARSFKPEGPSKVLHRRGEIGMVRALVETPGGIVRFSLIETVILPRMGSVQTVEDVIRGTERNS